jgi:hypothetical protein
MLGLPDGRSLALVVRSGEHSQELRVVEVRGDAPDDEAPPRTVTRIVAREVDGAALLGSSPDGRFVVFAAPSPPTIPGGGGVVGLWVADLRAPVSEATARARCLTNCSLSAGAPLGAEFVPLPSREEIAFAGDVLRAGPLRLPLGGMR